VSHGAALPHMRLPDLDHPEIVIVRARVGVVVDVDHEFLGEHASEPVHAFFFLVSPEENPGQHLRLLAQIAGQVDDKSFMPRWLAAENEQQLKELVLRHERFLSLRVRSGQPTESLIGQKLQQLSMPHGSLIALIHRDGRIVIPRGDTLLEEGDRLTIIGEPEGIAELQQTYSAT